MKILVALSGGIDSSVVAHMLKQQGHELIGVRFTLWSDPLAPAVAQILPSKCCNTQTAARAKSVAAQLAIPYHIVNLEEDFKREVVDPFLEGYREGLTPNPCIRCNRTIKFGKLMDIADQFACDAIATGHYARVLREDDTDGTSRWVLLEATDATKDQSYYLYGLTQEQLARVRFPLASMLKSQVYALAREFGVPVDDAYQESQDLCFFPEKHPEEFLKRYLGDSLQPGTIVRRDGTVVGEHRGLALYTYGQRRGLNVGGLKIPLEVVGKRPSDNQLVVADQGSEQHNEVQLCDLRWVSWVPESETSFTCRTRSLGSRHAGTLSFSGSHGSFRFSEGQSPLSPGQSLVLYKGEEVVGGGMMQ